MEKYGERMNKPHSSVFRNVRQISPNYVANLTDVELNQLMLSLFKAEAYKYKSPASEIRTNTEIKAGDDGCDGWTGKPEINSGWLGSTNTCWQFKAGTAGRPSRLKNEVTKKIPSDTLKNDGQFILVASGSTTGKSGEDIRRKVLVDDAKAAGLPVEKIDVIGSDRLANWCNSHLSVAAAFSEHPSGLWNFERWSNSEIHRVPWQANDVVRSELATFRSNLDFFTGEIKHLHIQGLPGVGKTRFALELCRGAEWCNSVVYILQASDLPVNELIADATNDGNVQLMLVVDEVQANQLELFRELIGQSEGRVRLITIGTCKTPDPIRIPSFHVKPLDHLIMSEVVKGWHPTMPPEHVEFVIRFADGFVRLAWLASNAVAMNPSINIRELLTRDEIKGFLDQMLGSDNRRPLHVVAALTSIGWSEDKQNVGEAVARQFGLDWNDVRAVVDRFNEKFGIAPRGGRFRYISPTPLGIYLAVEAWNSYPDILRSLPEILPSDEALDSYYSRLQSIASNPYAREFAREELSRFFSLSDFADGRSVRRWSAIASADPEQAASNIFRALIDTSIEDRKNIIGEARRQCIWTLVRLAWKASSFTDAVMSLALLAEAENETFANNATGEFVDRFQIYLGGTSLPYQDRMFVLDKLLAIERPTLTTLVIKAITKIGNLEWSRMSSNPTSDEVPEQEWYPKSYEEYITCIKEAVFRLNRVVSLGIPELQDVLLVSVDSLSLLLLDHNLRNLINNLFIEYKNAYPQQREALRRIIAGFIKNDRKYWKKLSEKDLEEIEELHSRFQETTLEARLLQFVGPETWDEDEQPDVNLIAMEFLSNPELLAEHWPWITSGYAGNGWLLGERLGKIDTTGILAKIMPGLSNAGNDNRVLSSYLKVRRNEMGDLWFDNWFTTQYQREPKPVTLLFGVVWRCGATDLIIRKLTEILENQEVSPNIVGVLTYGNWNNSISAEIFEPFLWAMFNAGHQATVANLLYYRINKKPTEMEYWNQLALHVATSPELIRSSQMDSFYWKGITSPLIPHHAVEIICAIMDEYLKCKSTGWFLELSDAISILGACFSQNPSESWNAIKSYLSMPGFKDFRFGFPRGFIDHIQANEVMTWVSEEPVKRADILSRLIPLNILVDDSIASQILGTYGDNEQIASSFFTSFTTGSWSVSSSAHWDDLACKLDQVSKQTSLIKLKLWSINSARHIRKMAERERKEEEEENI